MRILLLCLLCFVVQAAPTTNVKVTLRCQFGAHAGAHVELDERGAVCWW